MILDLFRVTGRVAVVTGAGRGLGAAAAVALAQAGADVVISARSADQLAKVAAQVEAAGRRALVVPADLSDTGAAAGLAAAAADGFGRLDIVVNNVGGAMPRPFPATKPRHLEAAFHFNVAVAHALTQAAVLEGEMHFYIRAREFQGKVRPLRLLRHPSPIEVGSIRLRQIKMPNSGKPELGWEKVARSAG